MSQPAFRYYARTSRSSKNRRALWSALRWSAALAVSLYLCWLILFPALSGAVGRWIHDRLALGVGGAMFLVPFMVGGMIYRFFKEGRSTAVLTMSAAALLSLTSAAGMTALLAGPFGASPAALGGGLGGGLAEGMGNALGGVGACGRGWNGRPAACQEARPPRYQ